MLKISTWTYEIGRDVINYSDEYYLVRFEMADAELEDVLAVVFELQIRMKKNLTFADGSFTDLTAAAYFEQQSGTASINRFDFSQYRRQRF